MVKRDKAPTLTMATSGTDKEGAGEEDGPGNAVRHDIMILC